MRIQRTYGRLAAVPALLLAVAALGQALGQSAPAQPRNLPPLAKEEIRRRGNLVEEMGQIQNGPMEAIIGAFAPPPDDSHKWYISVISKAGCPACERLKADFLRSEHLRAWVNVEQPEHSWAHYNVYRIEDATQRWRWQRIRLRAYPTIVIQPPRNGAYGPNSAVVFQKSGYDGDAEKLSLEMSKAIRGYVERLQQRGELRARAELGPRPASENPARQSGGFEQADRPELLNMPIGVDPPFDVGPKVDPRYPTGPLPEIPPAVDPDARPSDQKPKPKPTDVAERIKLLKKALPYASDQYLLERLADGSSIDRSVKLWWDAFEVWTMRAIGAAVVLLLLAAVVTSALWVRAEVRRGLRSAAVASAGETTESATSGKSAAAGSGGSAKA